MNILVDGIHLVPHMKGVGRYLDHTLRELARLDPALHFSILVLQPFPGLPPAFERIPIRYRNHLWHGYRTLPHWVNQLNPDAVWIPYEVPAHVPNRPFIMTCHAIPRLYRTSTRPIDRLDDWLLPKTLRRAKQVLCNSNYVATWVRSLGVPHVALAPCAPSPAFQPHPHPQSSPHPTILTFYAHHPHENFQIVPAVIKALLQRGLNPTWLIAGVKDHERPTVEARLAGLNVQIIPFFGHAQETELARLYSSATLYFDPSLEEGFGMQVIEAMACGTPVVCSNRAALPEVAGEAALLIDPTNLPAITDALITLLQDSALRTTLITRGLAQAAQFSWSRTAHAIHTALQFS